MKQIFLFILFAFSVATAFSQQQGIRVIGQPPLDYLGTSVLQDDQLYIVSNGTPWTSYTPVLMRMDTNYNLNMVKKIAGVNSDELTGMHLDSLGNMYLSGSSIGFGLPGENSYLVKINTIGNLVWAKTFSGTLTDKFKSMVSLSNGNFLTLGELPTVSASMNMLSVYYFDLNGDTLWTKIISDTTSLNAAKAIQLSNGNIVIASGSYHANTGFNLLLICMDLNGNILWTKKAAAALNTNPTTLFEGHDQKIYVSGFYGTNEPFLFQTDENGSTGTMHIISGMRVVSAGIAYSGDKIILGGYGYHNIAGENISRAMMIDTSANILWARQYGGYQASDISEIHTVNNRIIMTGYWSDGTVNDPDVMIITTDPNGNSNTCYEESFFPVITNIAITETTPGLSVFSANSHVVIGNATPLLSISGVNSYSLQNMTLSFSETSNLCDGLCNGSLTVTPSGGVSPYAVVWSNFSNNTTISNLCGGNYGVNVTDAAGCSVSDTTQLGTEAPVQEICMVTVDTLLDKNLIVWEKDMAGYIDHYNIYRNIAGADILIGFTPYDSLSQYVDTSSSINPNVTSYRYRVTTVDTCGNESELSSVHKTIHLTSSLGTGNSVNLVWDAYQGFTVSYYRIWRFSLPNGWELKDSVNSTNFTWTDLTPPSGILRYMIEVMAPVGCVSSRAVNHNSTRSNKGNIMNFNGTPEYYMHDKIQVYPNPSDGNFYFIIPENIIGEIEINITDVSGKIIHEELTSAREGEQYNINKNLQPGVYFINLQNGGSSFRSRIIISR